MSFMQWKGWESERERSNCNPLCACAPRVNKEWNIKPSRGRQRKVWSRLVDDLFKSLDIDKGEWL